MRVLVTGGAGFIGSHVVDRLTAAGIQARIFDLVPSPHHGAHEVETVLGDLLEPAALRSAMEGCDAVVHLAAMADVNVVEQRPADAQQVNAEGTLNVLQAARDAGVRRVVYASTIWVYSDVEAPTADEDTQLNPPGHLYTATKLAGELYCRSYAELYDLEYTILRFGIPYGPRARPEAVVPIFVRKALAGDPLTLAGGGAQSRRFVYVEDLAEGVVCALRPTAANRVYNLVGSEDVTIRDVADTVREAVGDTEIVHVPGRSVDFAGVEVCGQRAARELNWRPSTSFVQGVTRYVAWHRAHAPDTARGESPGEPRAVRARAAAGALGGGLRRAIPAAVLLGVAAVLTFLIWALRDLDAHADDLRTVFVTGLVSLTLYAALASDADGPSRPTSGWARLGWVAVGVVLAMVLRWPADPLHLAHSDEDLLLLSTLGSGLGVASGVAFRRLLRGRLRERPSDSGS
jgi:UDP-glucose 4-epimerase